MRKLLVCPITYHLTHTCIRPTASKQVAWSYLTNGNDDVQLGYDKREASDLGKPWRGLPYWLLKQLQGIRCWGSHQRKPQTQLSSGLPSGQKVPALKEWIRYFVVTALCKMSKNAKELASTCRASSFHTAAANPRSRSQVVAARVFAPQVVTGKVDPASTWQSPALLRQDATKSNPNHPWSWFGQQQFILLTPETIVANLHARIQMRTETFTYYYHQDQTNIYSCTQENPPLSKKLCNDKCRKMPNAKWC